MTDTLDLLGVYGSISGGNEKLRLPVISSSGQEFRGWVSTF